MASPKKTTRRDIEKQCSRQAFINKLRRLADTLERNEPFAIQLLGERVVVPEEATFAIEHERGRSSEEIEFQISWSTKPR